MTDRIADQPGRILRIGVLSDTHLADTPEARDFLESLVSEHLAPVDMILHAGDLVAPGLLDALWHCPVHAVRGNMDPASDGVPVKKIVTVAGFRIGLMHGWGGVNGLEDRLLAEFSEDRIDCLVYGHSHVAVCHERNGVLLFNPGSATDRRRMAFHSVGLLEIGHQLRGRIIPID